MNRNDPNLIDFPCSYSWRAYYQETFYGETLPSLEPKPELPSSYQEEPVWSARQWDKVRQLEGSFLHYQKKVIEYQKQLKEYFESRSSKRKYKKYTTEESNES